ncbi:MAG TPA: vitamin B12 dependent-methionine synthase activation domain-containing protein [Patescibacteria group bacterium]|nr:vitamin B12 dependent-methionine synthase activation domain-containing protein [Patescibacteria group bacterium]
MIDFPLSCLQPQEAAVYTALGLKSGSRPSSRSSVLLQQALELFKTCSEPLGLSEAIGKDEFADVFSGQGRNAPDPPLQKIFPRADSLLLFAFTLGPRISEEIKRLFASDDFALGSVLDAVASLAADQAGRVAEEWVERQAAGQKNGALPRAFLYSPGYCGWHISAQEKLFARLRPEKIGITLNESFLMTPLKSISGVLVAGPAVIHQFSEVYPFCAHCKSPTCRERGMARSA